MLKYEIIKEKFCKQYSDLNKMIKKIGTEEIYNEAVDLLSCQYKYEETDIEIIEQEDFINSFDTRVRMMDDGINTTDFIIET